MNVYSVGIDLGGTFTKMALVSPQGEILRQRSDATVAGREPAQALGNLWVVVKDLVREAGLAWPPQGGCGIGVPAVVDHRTGWVKVSGPLRWSEVGVGELAREIFGCEVVVDDDVSAGALADLNFGCARGATDLLYIAWGTGIGAGIVLSRRLYHSRGGAMNEFGHMPADPASTRLCYCGCRGCLEIEAGGKAMVAQAFERLGAREQSLLRQSEGLTVERMAWAAERGDRLSRSILERAAVLVARVLAGALALFNFDTVVFGGGVSQCFPLIQEVFDRELRLRAPGFSLASTQVLRSALGPNAGVVGAALLPADRRRS